MSKKDITNSPKIQEIELETLKGLFPQFFSEGNFDIDSFKTYLEGQTTDNNEFYRFEWTGKKNAKQIASKPTKNTLIPDKENSKNWEKTENLFIEGDNLEVLKLLLNKYYGQIKMIYIDPPYNKDKDFVYKDTWKDNLEDYLAQTGQVDENGETTTEKETTGRKHSNWLNMIYPRLILARKLLKEDGVIFVSIDDDEVGNLRKVMDDIFGEDNFLGCAGRVTKKSNNKGDFWAPNFDYILTYGKDRNYTKTFLGGINYEAYDQIETDGPRKGEKYQLVRLYMSTIQNRNPEQRFWIECPDGSKIIPPGTTFPPERPNLGDGIWRWSRRKFEEEFDKIVIKEVKSSNLLNENKKPAKWNVYTKTYLNDVIENSSAKPNSLIEKHINQIGSHELNELNIPFDYSKPSTLIEYLIEISKIGNNDIVLDFFAGSGTTAHAVMDLNKDGGNRKFICVQLPEKVAKNSEAEKAGYKTISEITRARIDKAGEKIKAEEGGEKVDIGFRAFKLAESNFKYLSEKYEINENTSVEQMELLMKKEVEETGLIDGRSEIDVIYELIIREGYSFYSSIEKLENGVYKISDENKYFYALIQEKLSEEKVRDFVKNHLEEKQVRFFALEESLSESARATLDTYFNLHNI